MKKLYFVAIALPSPTKEEITGLKEGFIKKYGIRHALKSPPHITLHMPMRVEADREVELIKKVKNACRKLTKGKFQLRGISSFPPRTVFIDVLKSDWLENTRMVIQRAMQEGGFGKLDDHFHPHVTLMTRDVNRETYARAFQDLKDLIFDDEVPGNEITLFKHDGKQWKELESFELA
ncbi:MAG: 2'-5' RNA ligase family protein [Vicingaceae bacterium]